MDKEKGLRAIIAVNNLGFIGIGNTMLWRSRDDFKHFKAMTDGCTLLVGHNTNLELPPLSNRTVIEDIRGHYNLDAQWCIGGKKTYEKYAPALTELHISHINDNGIGDVTFPDFRNLNPNCKIFNYHFDVSQPKVN